MRREFIELARGKTALIATETRQRIAVLYAIEAEICGKLVVETYAAVRRFVFLKGHKQRETSRVFGLSQDTIAKMYRYSVPPGYVRTRPAASPN